MVAQINFRGVPQSVPKNIAPEVPQDFECDRLVCVKQI